MVYTSWKLIFSLIWLSCKHQTEGMLNWKFQALIEQNHEGGEEVIACVFASFPTSTLLECKIWVRFPLILLEFQISKIQLFLFSLYTLIFIYIIHLKSMTWAPLEVEYEQAKDATDIVISHSVYQHPRVYNF